jgi:WD40 repeat protein
MMLKSSDNPDWTIAELGNLMDLTKKYGIDWFNKNFSLTRKPKEYLYWARPGGYLEQLTLAGDTLKSLGPYKSETIYSIFSSPDRQHLWMISNCYKTRSSKLREYRIETDDFYERLEWSDPKIEEAQLGVVSTDGRHLFIAHKDGYLRKWCSKTREVVKAYKHKKEFSWVECLSLTEDGGFILFGARSGDRYILRKCTTKNLKPIADYY